MHRLDVHDLSSRTKENCSRAFNGCTGLTSFQKDY